MLLWSKKHQPPSQVKLPKSSSWHHFAWFRNLFVAFSSFQSVFIMNLSKWSKVLWRNGSEAKQRNSKTNFSEIQFENFYCVNFYPLICKSNSSFDRIQIYWGGLNFSSTVNPSKKVNLMLLKVLTILKGRLEIEMEREEILQRKQNKKKHHDQMGLGI